MQTNFCRDRRPRRSILNDKVTFIRKYQILFVRSRDDIWLSIIADSRGRLSLQLK